MVTRQVSRGRNCKSFQGQHVIQIKSGRLYFFALTYSEYIIKLSAQNLGPNSSQNETLLNHFNEVKYS